MVSGWRRLAAVTAIAGLTASGAVTAAAVTRKPVVGIVNLELAGRTTIHWRGTAAVRLHAAANVSLPDPSGTRIWAKGTYAFVRLDDEQACGNNKHCSMASLSWTPSISDGLWGPDFNRLRPTGTDHLRNLSKPYQIPKGYTTIYLAADGDTTLEFITPDLVGARNLTVTKTWPITVQRLPINCRSPGGAACDPTQGYAAGRMRFGGATHDVGRLGYNETLVINAEGSDQIDSGVPGVPLQEPVGLLPCVYAKGTPVSEDPEPSHHTTGCELIQQDGTPDAAAISYLGTSSIAPFQSGRAASAGWTALSGRSYAGYVIDNALNYPEPTWREGWGIWLTYAR